MKTSKILIQMICVLLVLLVLFCTACDGSSEDQSGTTLPQDNDVTTTKDEDNYVDGETYFGGTFEGKGYGADGGIIRLAVTIDADKIVSVEVLEFNDQSSFFNRAWDQLYPELIKCTSTKDVSSIEICSGATCSSNGIITAFKNALMSAQR